MTDTNLSFQREHDRPSRIRWYLPPGLQSQGNGPYGRMDFFSSEPMGTMYSCGLSGKNGRYFAAIIAALSLFVTAGILSWPTVALHKINAEYYLSDVEIFLLTSLPKMAAVISPIPCSYIMDIIGRKTTLTYCLPLVAVSWLVLAVSQDLWLMMCARFFMGLWHGVERTTVSIYIAEVTDPDSRAWLISMSGLMFNLGVLYFSLISFTSYQTMTLLCILPTFLLFYGFLLIPESPYFFHMHGRRAEAADSLLWLCGEFTEDTGTVDMYRIETAVREQLTKPRSFKEIFSTAPNRKSFFMLECLTVCSATSAMMILLPHFYRDVALPTGWPNSYLRTSYNVYVCLAWVVFALIPPALIYTFRFLSVIMMSAIGTMAVFCLVLIRFMVSLDYLANETVMPFILLLSVVLLESIGITFVANIVQGEMFPINIKAKACALSCMTACSFEFINYLLAFKISTDAWWIIFVMSALTAALFTCIVRSFMIETKGKSLEEIQYILRG